MFNDINESLCVFEGFRQNTGQLTCNTSEMLRHYVGNRKKGQIFINEMTGKRLTLRHFEKMIDKWARWLNIQKLQTTKPSGREYHLITLMGLREAGERHYDLQWRLMCLQKLQDTVKRGRRLLQSNLANITWLYLPNFRQIPVTGVGHESIFSQIVRSTVHINIPVHRSMKNLWTHNWPFSNPCYWHLSSYVRNQVG